MYVSKNQKKISFIHNTIKNLNPDFVYINVVFSIFFSIYPLLLKIVGSVSNKFVICPRGVFNPHGMATKKLKKTFFLKSMDLLGAFNNISFHATTPLENSDIKKFIGEKRHVITVPNFPPSNIGSFVKRTKKSNSLSLIYIARIHPIKNLLFFLKLLKNISQIIALKIYGPVEDEAYWIECKKEIEKSHHQISYEGELIHKDVHAKLLENDFFVLPTTGENFGHSILESFMAGRPVLIANTTPWKNIAEEKIGWDLSIEKEDEFIEAINTAFKMGNDTYAIWSRNSWEKAKKVIQNPLTINKYKSIFSNG